MIAFTLFIVVATCTEDRTPTAPPSLSAVTEATITHTLLTSGHDPNNVKIYTTASIAPAGNALVTVAVLTHQSSSAAPAPTLSGGGMASWDLVATVGFNGATPLDRVSIFRAMSASRGSGPITITSSVTVSNCQWIVSQWDGAETSGTNGGGAIVQTGSAIGTAVNGLTVTLASFASPSNAAYGVFGIASNTAVATAGSGFTRIDEQPSGESTTGDLFAEWAVNDNTVDATWSNKSAGALGVEIKAAGGGGGGGVSASQSTVTASPSSITAGSGSSTITVTAKDASGNPVSGATVVLSATGSGNTVTQPSGPTNGQGVATGTLSSTVAEAKTVSATANGVAITQTASVTVTPSGSGGTITHTLLTAGTNTTNQSVYTTDTITPTANTLITVAVLGRRSTGAQTPTITGGGMTSWTLVASVSYDVVSTPLSRVSVFRAMSGAPARGPLTITFPNSQSNATWIVSQWNGVDTSGTNGAGAIVQSVSARGDAVSTLSATLGALADPSDVAYGVVGVGMNGPAVTPGSGFTEIAEPTSGESNLLEAEWGVNVTTVAASWTTAKNSALLAIEFKAGAGTGGVVPALPPDSIPDSIWAELYAPGNVAPRDSEWGAPYPRNLILLGFRDDASQAQRQAAIDQIAGEVVGGVYISPGSAYYVRIEDDGTTTPLWTAIRSLRSMPQVELASPNLPEVSTAFLRPHDGPNWTSWKLYPDSADGQNWALERIAAPLAWGCSTGDSTLTVGVVDHGFHSVADLNSNIDHANPVTLLDAFPDTADHGTGVGSILAARGNNDTGMTGVMWRARLELYEAYYPSRGSHYALDWIKNIRRAAFAGAKVINVSAAVRRFFTVPTHSDSDMVKTVYQYAKTGIVDIHSQGLHPLLVLAAGDVSDDAWWGAWPILVSDFPQEVITVATSDVHDALGTKSNRGPLVHIAAPGVHAYRLRADGSIEDSSGTSLAAPLVSGVAGLLFSFDPRLDAQKVYNFIVNGALAGGRTAGGIPILNAYESLKLAAREPGAPLCGNRVWVSNRTLVAERNPDTHTTETLAQLNEDAYWANVLHGGRRIEVYSNTAGVLSYAYALGGWTLTSSEPITPSGGTYLSTSQVSHDLDSLVEARTNGVRGGLDIYIRDLTTGVSSFLTTRTDPLPVEWNGSACVEVDSVGTCTATAPTGPNETDWHTLAYSPLGDEVLLAFTRRLSVSTGTTAYEVCPLDPQRQCRSVLYTESPESTVVHLIRIQDGAEAAPPWSVGGKDVWWAGISEDGKQLVLGESVMVFPFRIRGTGHGTQLVGDPQQFNECYIAYREYRTGRELELIPVSDNTYTCVNTGRGTIAPVKAAP